MGETDTTREARDESKVSPMDGLGCSHLLVPEPASSPGEGNTLILHDLTISNTYLLSAFA